MRYFYNKKDTLETMKTKLDALKSTIKFVYEDSDETSTIESIIDHAFRRKPTAMVYSNGKSRRQELGGTRSLEDLYLLCKHYHPNTKLEDVRDVLKGIHKKKMLHFNYCSTHRKMMFHKSSYPMSSFPTNETRLLEIT